MDYSLFLTKIHREQFKEKKKLFLGKWCVAEEINLENLNDYKVIDYHWNNTDKLNQDYQYLYNLYYRVIKQISKELNNIHNTNNTERFWHMIVGCWVYKFIVNTFEKWEQLNIALNNFQISKTYYYDCPNNYFIPTDFPDFNNLAATEIWNNFVTYSIIKYCKKKINFEKLDFKYQNKKKYITNIHFSKYNKLEVILDKLLSNIQKNPRVTLYKTYFGKVNNLRLFLKLGSIPRNYKEFEERINIGDPGNRSKLHLNIDTKNTFEIFIKENLYKFMPVSYLEGFKKINNYTQKIKTKTDLIISGVGDRNDVFSIWAADLVKNRTNYFYSSHGGITENVPKFDSCIYKYDCFLSWNQSEKKNVHQISPQYYVNKKIENKGNNLYVILTSPSLYTHFINYSLKSGQGLESYEDLKILKKLNKDIKDRIKFRMHPNAKLWMMKERVIKDFGKKTICTHKKIIDCFSNSKIVLEQDLQTSFYEAMNLGIPTLAYTNREFTSDISKPIKTLFEDLVVNDVIINNKLKLIEHIEKIWENPLEWWESNKIIKLRKKFELLCSKKNKKFIDDILHLKNYYSK